ncbi:MAG TPA: hypothetical protein PK440_01180 [Candidatus Accumulibacter phosphatis]|nr:MAG: hypothetical protein AW07_00560 [Candidatus Accumulibacter sp. SK-11]HAY27950.1 hypothetical protein [Accumulibacter sp.]HCN67424.1 hypothetical protein [Accumulibacter sp.]HRL76009.1 hypothetical protein [Candidatus Accumulibacter phosphatis]HRQ93616.1 hypothetical protein [Candidatus Accumulibacter phosphatis]
MSEPVVDRQQITLFDQRPFFERALVHGVQSGVIDRDRLTSIVNDGAKGLLQIADFFGTQYLRPNIEEARTRIISLVSLFLEESSSGDLDQAARSLRDNSFLSHSRGGSEMLKKLWAMPEDASYGILAKPPQKEFLAEWSLRSLRDYRQELAQRQDHQLSISATLWFAKRLALPAADLSTVAVDSVVRSALLVHLHGKEPLAIPTASGLLQILDAIREKGVPGKGRRLLADLLRELPESYLPVAQRELRRIETEDLPRIADRSRPLPQLLQELEPLYYLRDFGPEDAGLFEAAACADWQRITAGKTDDSSLLTVFVCLAADIPAKPVLGRAAARALIVKARRDGFKRLPVLGFIHALAPYSMQDDLETLWKEFFPEAHTVLLDAADTTLTDALDFLRENCNVV